MPPLALDWLNQQVPLWAALIAAFSSPAEWAGYAKRVTKRVADRATGKKSMEFGKKDDNG